MSTENMVDGAKFYTGDFTKIVFDGDMRDAIHFPFNKEWFQLFKKGKILSIGITDYSNIGGEQASTVRFDINQFCN